MAQIHYTEAQINAQLDLINALLYTASEINALLEQAGLSAPLDAPAFTGIPTAPDCDGETDTGQIANTAFVQTVTDAKVSVVLGDIATILASVVGG